MSALSALPISVLRQQLAQLTPEQRRALGLSRPASDAEAAAYDRTQQPAGAPTNFAGAVFQNPDGVRVSDDTESGIEPLRLMSGVNLQHQNFTGTMPGDTSSPAQAQIVGPHMQTIAAQNSGKPLFDMSKAQAVGKPLFDMSQAQPVGAAAEEPAKKTEPPQGWLDREIPLDSYGNATLSGIQSLGRAGRDFVKGTASLFAPPQDETESAVAASPAGQNGLPIFRVLRGMGHTAADSTKVLDAIHDINASPDPVGTYGKALQEMASEGAVQALAALATEGAIRGVPKAAAAAKATAGDALSAVKTAVKPAARAAGSTLRAVGESADPDLVGLASPRAAHALKYATKVGKVLEKAGAEGEAPVYPGAALPEDPGTFPGAPLPEAPAPEALQARVLEEGGQAPPPEPHGALGEISTPAENVSTGNAPEAGQAAVEAPETPAQILNKPGTPAELGKALNDALGGKPLQRGVSLRNQGQAKPSAAPAEVPKGFTPVESSALKGFKYDPATREFDSITSDGRHYVHGDVSPEAAQAFGEAESKGRAWQAIRNNNPLVAKVIDGKRISIVKRAGLQNEVTPAAEKPSIAKEDLTALLKQSVKDAQSKKIATAKAQPRFVYRARDVGEEGVPLQPHSHGQATSEPLQAVKYAEAGQRGTEQGQVVRIDLSKLKPSDYVVETHPDGMKWIRFTRPLTESEVSHFAGAGQPAGKLK